MSNTVDFEAYTKQKLRQGELLNLLKGNHDIMEQLQHIIGVLVSENKLLIDRVENGK